MNREEYDQTQSQMLLLVSIVNDMPLREFIEAGETAMSIAPVINPTLWMKGHVQLGNVINLAKALRKFQAEIHRQVEDANR